MESVRPVSRSLLSRALGYRVRIGYLRGTPLELDVSWLPAFFIIYGTIFSIFVGISHQALTAVFATLLFYGCLLIHEYAHVAVARRDGLRVQAILLRFFGAVALIDGEPASAQSEAAIVSAGPIASALLAAGSALLTFILLVCRAPVQLVDIAELLLIGNISICLYNLAPIEPADGGRLIHALIWHSGGDRNQASRISALLATIEASALIAIAGSAYVFWHKPASIMFVGLGILILGNAKAQYANARSRTRDGRTR